MDVASRRGELEQRRDRRLRPRGTGHVSTAPRRRRGRRAARPSATDSRVYSGASSQPWRIYAYTDRPAYRPGEEAKWKLVARQYGDGRYSTPATRVVEYEIVDPRGSKVVDGRATLNEFGSAWGGLQLAAAMPLGEYRVTFWDEGRHTTIGSATLFRLEEYKLPEFKVSSRPPSRTAAERRSDSARRSRSTSRRSTTSAGRSRTRRSSSSSRSGRSTATRRYGATTRGSTTRNSSGIGRTDSPARS